MYANMCMYTYICRMCVCVCVCVRFIDVENGIADTSSTT